METTLQIVEGMQFDRGYLSPYFVTNAEKEAIKCASVYLVDLVGLTVLEISIYPDISGGCARASIAELRLA